MREEKKRYIFNYMQFIRNIFKDKYVESKIGKGRSCRRQPPPDKIKT